MPFVFEWGSLPRLTTCLSSIDGGLLHSSQGTPYTHCVDSDVSDLSGQLWYGCDCVNGCSSLSFETGKAASMFDSTWSVRTARDLIWSGNGARLSRSFLLTWIPWWKSSAFIRCVVLLCNFRDLALCLMRFNLAFSAWGSIPRRSQNRSKLTGVKLCLPGWLSRD